MWQAEPSKAAGTGDRHFGGGPQAAQAPRCSVLPHSKGIRERAQHAQEDVSRQAIPAGRIPLGCPRGVFYFAGRQRFRGISAFLSPRYRSSCTFAHIAGCRASNRLRTPQSMQSGRPGVMKRELLHLWRRMPEGGTLPWGGGPSAPVLCVRLVRMPRCRPLNPGANLPSRKSAVKPQKHEYYSQIMQKNGNYASD